MANNSTRTDVINDALLVIGETTVLSSTDKAMRAKKMDRMFDQVKKFVFRLQPWSCLIKRKVVASESEAPPFGYAYKFLIPPDSLRIVKEYDGVKYQREGKYLLSDSSTLKLIYVEDKDDYSQLDSHLYSLLVSYLAYIAAIPITGKKWIMEEMKARYAEALGESLSSDSFESTPEEVQGVDDYNIMKMFGGIDPFTVIPIDIEEGT